jgi:hypothetical protein
MGKGESLWERGGELNDELQSWYLPLYWMQQAEREQARYEGRLAPFAQALVQAADTIRASAREILPGCTSGDLRMAAEVPFYELTLACIGHGPLTPPECDLVRMYLNNRPGVAVCCAHKLRGVGRAISTLAACKEFFPTYTPPEKTDFHLICACGRKLCEAFDKLMLPSPAGDGSFFQGMIFDGFRYRSCSEKTQPQYF